MTASGQLNPALYDFVDYTATHDAHEDYADLVEQKIFKFKYRLAGDGRDVYLNRQKRMIDRFMERAKTRDPQLE